MSLILNIDTAVETASLCLSRNAEIIALEINTTPYEHAAWIQPAIRAIMEKSKLALPELDAIAVSIGPGSYTGLRIGLSAAKGLCFALNIPLITVSTLKMMAAAVKNKAVDLICPMIDARRMEVFTALYNKSLDEKEGPQNLVLDENSFSTILASFSILFTGNGCKKFQQISRHTNAIFDDTGINASALVELSFKKHEENDFADLAYTEPAYIKEFYAVPRKE
jgi:tRNA threonylcarbamoyladenosine biosynthesis protein TsaB